MLDTVNNQSGGNMVNKLANSSTSWPTPHWGMVDYNPEDMVNHYGFTAKSFGSGHRRGEVAVVEGGRAGDGSRRDSE